MEKVIRALIAENDFSTRWRMKRLIEPHIVCDIAVNSDEVISAFDISQEDGTPYDLMLIDVGLPGNQLIDTIGEIRAKEDERNIFRLDRIKFVAISPEGHAAFELDTILPLCEGHVSRPINKGDVLGQLHSMGYMQA